MNLTTANCPSFCLDPDTNGEAWWEVDMAALYHFTHIHLLGAGLQNLTYDIKLYSVKNDGDAWQDVEEKVCRDIFYFFAGQLYRLIYILDAYFC